MVNIGGSLDVLETGDVERRRRQRIKNSYNLSRWPMGSQNGRNGLFSTRLVFAIPVAMILLIGGTVAGQEFRPDKDYSPNDYEKTLIEEIKTAAKPDTGAMKFILRMPLAIENACKALANPTPEAIDSIMEDAGGHHKVIFRETMEKLQSDSGIVAEVMADMPQQGHFAVRTVDSPKGSFLIVYWSDIAFKWFHAKDGSGYGKAVYPGDLDFFRIGLSARVALDSLKYILYRGVSSIVIPVDSIVESRSFATTHDSFDVSIEFYKKRFDIWTVNLYALNRTIKRYDLVAMLIPACVVDRPPRPIKK